ncbi:MAG: hypothetical protein JO053_03050 [Acidobacteria bacterium]|nr:hypothetical protein [Acidobacteriota bacterium]
MSSFVVRLDDDEEPEKPNAPNRPTPAKPAAGRKGRTGRILLLAAGALVLVASIVGIAGYLYYRSFYKTPQYSLALLVDAAKRDDKTAIDGLIDIDGVVEDFVPQVTDKAIELYGKGQPPMLLDKVKKLAAPLMPAVKQQARDRLPKAIRDRADKFGYVPFFAMVMGAGRYLDIAVTGDDAVLKSKLTDHPLELKMHREGDRWKVVGVKDEPLATDIAQKIGQQIIALATNGMNKKTAEKLGVGNLADLLKQVQDLVK